MFAESTSLDRKSEGAKWRSCPERSRTVDLLLFVRRKDNGEGVISVCNRIGVKAG
jgi:hypothetical protein